MSSSDRLSFTLINVSHMPRFRSYSLSILAAVFTVSACSRGVTLCLSNASATAIHEVVITYLGSQALVGDLLPGSAKEVVLAPTGETSVTISFRRANGPTVTHDLDVYLEPGYRGTIDVELQTHDVVVKERDVQVR
jgi:hypothetical protein